MTGNEQGACAFMHSKDLFSQELEVQLAIMAVHTRPKCYGVHVHHTGWKQNLVSHPHPTAGGLYIRKLKKQL